MMKQSILICLIASICCLFASNGIAQRVGTDAIKNIEARSKLWNTTYNSRDSLAFYTLFDPKAVVTSLGGRWIGAETCKQLCRSLYSKRPDISWYNTPSKIEVNEQWPAAYETGTWSESWTEPGDRSKSEIVGKYWIMWKYQDDAWYILSAIYTPLKCTGSYCNK
jgi:ketosteroid isomerase-like protein